MTSKLECCSWRNGFVCILLHNIAALVCFSSGLMFVCRFVLYVCVYLKILWLWRHVIFIIMSVMLTQEPLKVRIKTVSTQLLGWTDYLHSTSKCQLFLSQLYWTLFSGWLNSKGKCREGLKGTLGILKLGTCQYKDPCSYHVIATILYNFF